MAPVRIGAPGPARGGWWPGLLQLIDDAPGSGQVLADIVQFAVNTVELGGDQNAADQNRAAEHGGTVKDLLSGVLRHSSFLMGAWKSIAPDPGESSRGTTTGR